MAGEAVLDATSQMPLPALFFMPPLRLTCRTLSRVTMLPVNLESEAAMSSSRMRPALSKMYWRSAAVQLRLFCVVFFGGIK